MIESHGQKLGSEGQTTTWSLSEFDMNQLLLSSKLSNFWILVIGFCHNTKSIHYLNFITEECCRST